MPEEPQRRGFYALSYEDDHATIERGTLIPGGAAPTRRPRVLLQKAGWHAKYTLIPALSVLFLTLFFSSVGYAALRGVQSLASPIVVVENPYTKEATLLQYGVEMALSEPSFFSETRNAFISAAETFIEVDLPRRQLRFFEDGVLTISTPVIAKGETGSVWETPAGLYEVQAMRERYYSSLHSVYLPWSINFQGNSYIHGWPTDKDGNPIVNATVGGIRIDTDAARRLFEATEPGTPIIVHEREQVGDDFLYEPKVPELETPHYLLADLKNNTVLAASDLDAIVPIASLTKLMTAVVALEHISLDERVWITEPNLVQSLIPRLGERNRVSMYSLLQLLLIESSNEAADVIAAQLGREQFIARMNEKAAELGLRHTQFADPSGLSSDNLSTVGDLLRLSKYIADNRQFIFKVTADQEVAAPYTGGEFGELTNFNRVAGLKNFIGGKVGETEAAGQTSVTLHELEIKGQTRTIVIILLGSQSRSTDVTELLEYAKERFR